MKLDIDYKLLDAREEHESFRDCVIEAIKHLEVGQGLHVIKEFNPLPLYKMMDKNGFDKHVEKINEEEFHIYFSPKAELKQIEMKAHLQLNQNKVKYIVDVKTKFLNDIYTLDEAKELLHSNMTHVTAQEFTLAEQYLQEYGISDELLADRIEVVFELFKDLLTSDDLNLPPGHPIHTYIAEVKAIRKLLAKIKVTLEGKFIKNVWLEIYEQLDRINTHFVRKQNQLYPLLEKKGFDKPSGVMWTLENDIRDLIKRAYSLLSKDDIEEFANLQADVIESIEDMMVKEMEILYPTSMDLISDDEFIYMRQGDDEIGYCLINQPPLYKDKIENNNDSGLMKDLSTLLSKYGLSKDNNVLDVSQGKLTLEQINLIFKHLSVDLSYVDEDDLVKFYSDTKHRVFPRSPGVIGREVKNCHPKESVHMVEEIVRAFKAGQQDQAEFWLEIGDKFIYIIYSAVRDEYGNYRGILEMMQDITRLRQLEGSQRLLSWENENKVIEKNEYGISSETILSDLLKEYPFLKKTLISLSPKFKKLNNPLVFKTMSAVATLDMISSRENLKVKDVIDILTNAIKEQ